MTESKKFFINLNVEDVDRFDLSKFMLREQDVYDPMTASIFEDIPNLKSGGRYTVKAQDRRPDLISFEIYETTQYWWVLLIYNGLTSFNEIENGEDILYPSISALEDYYFSLKVKQNKSDKE